MPSAVRACSGGAARIHLLCSPSALHPSTVKLRIVSSVGRASGRGDAPPPPNPRPAAVPAPVGEELHGGSCTQGKYSKGGSFRPVQIHPLLSRNAFT